MSTIQYVVIGVGVLIALSSYGMDILNFLKGFLNKSVVVPTIPDVVIPDAPIVPIPSSPSRKERIDTFAKIVLKWENFTNILVDHGMNSCASDMKDLLVKMAQEYRVDLEEVKPKKKEKIAESDITSILIN
jgi:hypothetical protein